MRKFRNMYSGSVVLKRSKSFKAVAYVTDAFVVFGVFYLMVQI